MFSKKSLDRIPEQRRIIGKRIRERRADRGVTLQDLASRLGKSPATLCRIESGQQAIDVDTFLQLARELDMSPYRTVLEVQLAEAVDGPSRRTLEVLGRLLDAIEMADDETGK